MEDYGWHLGTKYEHLIYALMREQKDEAVCINGIEVNDVNIRENTIVLSMAGGSEMVITYAWARKTIEA